MDLIQENSQQEVDDLINIDYQHGFVTSIESDTLPPGLSEEVVRTISAKKNEPEWVLKWRLKAYRRWLDFKDPEWAHIKHPDIDFQAISYYSAPRKAGDGPKNLDEIDPQLLDAYNKLGIPLEEQKVLSGIAVDAVFDSVSVATTFRAGLAEAGVIFCSLSEAIQQYPDLVKKYMGSVVPYSDNFYACLNAAVFSDGTFVYIPKGVHCPMELSTYFRINEANTGQLSAHLLLLKLVVMLVTWKAVLHRGGMNISCTLQWLN